jgi:hypothetical protein
MALLDNILGGNNGGILGGNDSSQQSRESSEQNTQVATNPNFGFDAQDVLRFENSDNDDNSGDSEGSGGGERSSFTGIGDISFDFGAPTFVGTSSSNESSERSSQDGNGGLLTGIA